MDMSTTPIPPTTKRSRAPTEVTEKATRRTFTKEYKVSILERADRCSGPGELGKLLRQEGLYSSHLSSWRDQRRQGILEALSRKRGPKQRKTAEQVELDQLRAEVARLRKKLGQAEKIIDVQKKLSEVLGIEMGTDEDAPDRSSNKR